MTDDGRNLRERVYCGVFRSPVFQLGKLDIDELERYMFLVEHDHNHLDVRRGTPSIQFENHFRRIGLIVRGPVKYANGFYHTAEFEAVAV